MPLCREEVVQKVADVYETFDVGDDENDVSDDDNDFGNDDNNDDFGDDEVNDVGT